MQYSLEDSLVHVGLFGEGESSEQSWNTKSPEQSTREPSSLLINNNARPLKAYSTMGKRVALWITAAIAMYMVATATGAGAPAGKMV